ncbi:FkbM family methyltransferase [Pseudoduganella lutea]|uniref:FkbM family methyltransferase n=1 Tax=Pseudoduganella lutea TaxID=321985 RepID=A0A4P6KZT7_9BURK|nr:FkbM family methyltransferase [Pseudoduganella lutea]QBE64610.1 FkbM family methyltransferase [Pseudoduganella lutea]
MSELRATSLDRREAAALISGLYRALLGRAADPSGLAYWTGRLMDGTPVADVLAAITASEEYAQARTVAHDSDATRQRVLATAAPLLRRELTIVDIGAQELEGESHVYAPLTGAGLPYRIIGFEPQEDKIEASRRANPDSRVTLYPTFIGDGGRHTFHINNEDATSSLLPLNDALNRELVDLSHLATVQRLDVATSRLDDVLAGTGPVDFLKLDIQGFELPVLRHAQDVLGRTNVIHCEVSFAPIYENQGLFSEVEQLLRAAGFHFIDFSSQCHYASHCPSGNRSRDRLGWGDALFLRAPDALDPDALLAQCLTLLLVYDKPSLAESLARRFDAIGGTALAAAFAQERA